MRGQRSGKALLFVVPGTLFVLSLQGCLATRGWVGEQIAPLSDRVSALETHLGETDDKANRALAGLENLRLERRFVLNLKEGATFAPSSAALTAESKKAIAGFLGDLDDLQGSIFLVTGHTDSVGSEEANYALGQKRATSVAEYLIIKGADPLRVTAVSYGKNAPLADNKTVEGRRKNRCVEIFVYKEAITTAPRETKGRTEVDQPAY
jgi:outer membrane protein OmpA-like peptidoglycan-associated protein